jgi:hypothetical protein
MPSCRLVKVRCTSGQILLSPIDAQAENATHIATCDRISAINFCDSGREDMDVIVETSERNVFFCEGIV